VSGGPLRVGCIGMGWWSDVLADAIQRSGKLEIVSCFTRSEEKRQAFAAKYRCRPVARRCWPIPGSRRSSTPRRRTCIWRPRPPPPASTCSSTNRSPTPSLTAAPSPRPAAKPALGYQRRRESQFRIRRQIDDGRFGELVNAAANISRDRLAKIDLTSWRSQAAGRPGGVMLQVGSHYIDVLEYLIGPIRSVRRQSAQLVLPGDNPDPGAQRRRAVDGERELRLGVRVLSDEHLRQGRHRLLRFAKARRKRAHSDTVCLERHPGRGVRVVCRRCARRGTARSRGRVRDEIVCGGARRHSLGAGGTPGRGRGDIGQ
jgi:hypothetical protein